MKTKKKQEKPIVEKDNFSFLKKYSKFFALILIIGTFVVIAFAFMSEKNDVPKGNVLVDFRIDALDEDGNYSKGLIAGKETVVTFTLKDEITGKPISDINPKLSFLTSGEHDNTKEHQHANGLHLTSELKVAKVQLFVMNSKRGTIEVVDAFGSYDARPTSIKGLGTMSSKLIVLKEKPGHRAEDIASGIYGAYLYVTLPNDNEVAVINTKTHDIVKYISVGKLPGLMFVQPKSKFIWISNEGEDTVGVIDTIKNTFVKSITTGKGYHQVAFSPEYAFVTNSYDNKVSVISLDNFEKILDINVDKVPYGIAYSNISKNVYVSNAFSGTISVIDVNTHKIKTIIQLEKGVENIKVSPDGKRVVAINKYTNNSYIIDTKTDKNMNTVDTGESPESFDFMEDFVLIRNAYSVDVTYINMIDPRVSNNAIVGNRPPINLTPSSISSTEEGYSTIVTSPIEGIIYFMHKMNGHPMAMTSTRVEFGSDSVEIVENKIHETSPGVYQQYVIFENEGPYGVDFSSEIVNASYQINIFPPEKSGPVSIPLFDKTVKNPASLKYRITDIKTSEPIKDLKDIVYLVVRPSPTNMWTKRFASNYLGDGIYEANITFPENGDYMIGITGNSLLSMGYETKYSYVTVN